MKIRISSAGPRDAATLIELMRGLAKYEKLPPPGPAEARRFRAALGGNDPRLYAMLAHVDGVPAGYAIYFHTFSSFLVRPTLYLEDIFILPEHRRHGIGGKLFKACVMAARRRGCGRMEWTVLDWNEPAHRFYRKTKARVLKEWITYRLTLRRDAF